MHIFDKIKKKMCMSKTSAVIGFRVTLRYAMFNPLYLVHAPKLVRSDPGLRKGICCISLKELKQKIEKKFPPGSGSLPLFTDDETEVG